MAAEWRAAPIERVDVSAEDATVPVGQRACLGWLVERMAGVGSCSLGVECDALAWLDDYAAYRALHPKLRADWLDDYEAQ